MADVFGHAYAGVADGDGGFVVDEGDFGADFAVLGGVADGVVEEDAEKALEEELVAFDVDGFAGEMPVEEDAVGFGEVFDAAAAVDDEVGEVDWLEGDLVNEVVAAGKGEERVEEGGGGAALSDDLVEVFAVLGVGAFAVEGELRGGEHDGDGGAEVVGGVGGELAEAGDGGFEAGEELVPGYGEVLDLVFGRGDREPRGEIADTNTEGGAGHAVDGLEGVPAKEVADESGEQKQAGHEEKEDFAVGVQDLELLFERAAEVEANGLGLEFAWELDDVAEDEDGLVVEDDGGVGGLGAVFSAGKPVGGGLVGIFSAGKRNEPSARWIWKRLPSWVTRAKSRSCSSRGEVSPLVLLSLRKVRRRSSRP